MRIVVVGGTGFIGQEFLDLCQERYRDDLDLTLVTRRRERAEHLPPWLRPFVWDTMENPLPPSVVEGVDAVVNLAGAPVVRRWTPQVKRLIRDSRVLTTRNIVEAMGQAAQPPKVLVNASAVGYYGDRGEEELTEDSVPGEGFLSEVCQLWEEEARRASGFGVRVVYARFGIVLGYGGGALERMLPAFEWGIGGRLGTGNQWMPWVHRTDASRMLLHAIEDEGVEGAMNVVSPNPVRNREFTRALARVLGKPALLPVPSFALRLMFGEGASVLLESQKVLPKKAQEKGFRFAHPEIEEALAHILYWRREWLRRTRRVAS